jgi:hypothetical protein
MDLLVRSLRPSGPTHGGPPLFLLSESSRRGTHGTKPRQVLSCQSLNVVVFKGPDSTGAYSVLKALGRGCWELGRVLSRGDEAD